MRIRQVTTIDDRIANAMPLRAYAFHPSPLDEAKQEQLHRVAGYHTGELTLLAEDDSGATLAAASALQMRQNVRGRALPMAGVAGVASHPLARRQGHVRTLLHALLDRVRDEGYVLSALYPFRPSFYARFGYVGLPKLRTASFSPADLAPLLTAELPGEVEWVRFADGYRDYQAFTERLLAGRHGFATFPDYRAARHRDDNDRWLVLARVDGEITGALTYRIAEHAGDLVTDPLLTTGPLGRALLLRFLAHHADQVARIVTTVAPDETPELWAIDLTAHTEARLIFPDASAPMARVLSMTGLAGLPVGPSRVIIEIVDDRYLTGRWLLDGASGEDGELAVQPAGDTDRMAATLTAAGFSALVYGVLDPVEVVVRGLGTIPGSAVEPLRTLFPRRMPYLTLGF